MRPPIAPFPEESSDDSDVDAHEAVEVNGTKDGSGDKPRRKEKISNGSEDAENGVSEINEKPQCKVKEYESRYNLKGEAVIKEVGSSKDADASEEGLFALRYYKYYFRDSTLYNVVLKIFSPHIQQALQFVIKSYPRQNLVGNPIILDGPDVYDALGCLFHYRTELQDYIKSVESVAVRLDVQLLLNLADREFRMCLERYRVHVESPSEDPRVVFTDIWMIFKPGELLVAGEEETERILRVLYTDFACACGGNPAKWSVVAETFAHDGQSFGYVEQWFTIKSFKGTKSVARLPVRPLKYHEDVATLRKRQIARGTRLCDLVGIQHRAYRGKAQAVEHHKEPTPWGGTDKYTYEDLSLNGRVIVDHLTFIKFRTDNGIAFHNDIRIDEDAVTEDDLVCSHYQVPGFALLEKRWCWFRVDQLSDVEWDEEAFKFLLLPSGQKRIVRALTRQATSQDDSFDDMIKGKGRGCIFLLHGPPGGGKTFTVESVADKVKRPLYVMMSGEFGSSIEAVERNLRRVLELVTTWKAVLLIDEADVFLERRSSQDLARNGLVSIFLRTLEYFSGIMFLTTNRVDSFDLAFQSRIHLALKYHPLEADERAELWKLFLKRTTKYREQEWPAKVVERFAAVELNGRQIKNVCRTSNALAISESRVLSPEDIELVLKTVVDFDEDFKAEAHAAMALQSVQRSWSLGSAGIGGLDLDRRAP